MDTVDPAHSARHSPTAHQAAAGAAEAGAQQDTHSLAHPVIWRLLADYLDLFSLLDVRLINKALSVAAGGSVGSIFMHLNRNFDSSPEALQHVVDVFPHAKIFKLCLGKGGFGACLKDLMHLLAGNADNPYTVALAERERLVPQELGQRDMVAVLKQALPNLAAVLPHHLTLSVGPLCKSKAGEYALMNMHKVPWLKSLVLVDAPFQWPDNAFSGLTQLERLFVGCYCSKGGRHGRLEHAAESVARGAPNLKSLTLNGCQVSTEINRDTLMELARLTGLEELQVACQQGRLPADFLGGCLSSLKQLTRLCFSTITGVTCDEAMFLANDKNISYSDHYSDDDMAALDTVEGRFADYDWPPQPPKLQRVMFGVTYMSGALVSWLAQLKSLKQLTLLFSDGMRHMPAGAWAELQAALPPSVQLTVKQAGDSEMIADICDSSSWCEVPEQLGLLSSMQTLELGGCRTTMTGLLTLLGRLPQLRRLKLSSVSLQADDAWTAQHLQAQLKQLKQLQQKQQQQEEEEEEEGEGEGESQQDGAQQQGQGQSDVTPNRDQDQRSVEHTDQCKQQQDGSTGPAIDSSSASASSEGVRNGTLLHTIAHSLPLLRHLIWDFNGMRQRECEASYARAFLAVDDVGLGQLARICPSLEYVVMGNSDDDGDVDSDDEYEEGDSENEGLAISAGSSIVTEEGFVAFVAQLPALRHASVCGYSHGEKKAARVAVAGKRDDVLGVMGSVGEIAHNHGTWPDDEFD